MAALALGALGVVYGDIGTSPLYAFKESFGGKHGVAPTPENVLGILSLVVWAMTFVVTFKYLTFVMRADNRGEGGILALMALVGQTETTQRGRRTLLVARALRRGAPLRRRGHHPGHQRARRHGRAHRGGAAASPRRWSRSRCSS